MTTAETETVNLMQQKEFDEKYINTSEIVERLGIERASIGYAMKKGLLPPPIHANKKTYLWLRSEVEPRLEKWKISIECRKGIM